MKRERQPREKKEFVKGGAFKKKPFINYDDDYESIKEYVYGVLDNVCDTPENKELGKEFLKDTINALTAIDPSRVFDWQTDRYAIRYFAKKWVGDYISSHGVDELHEKVSGMFNWLAEFIYDNTNLFTSDVARSRPFDFVHVYILPRLFMLAEIDNPHIHRFEWGRFKSLVTNMMVYGNDKQYKDHIKQLVSEVAGYREV